MPPPRRAVDLERPVEHRDPVDEPAEARAIRRVGAADAVVRHEHVERAVRLRDLDPRRRRLRVLRDVRERLRDDVVRGRLGLRREALVRRATSSTGIGARDAERLERGAESAVGEDGGMDPAGELAQFRERLRQLLARAGE